MIEIEGTYSDVLSGINAGASYAARLGADV